MQALLFVRMFHAMLIIIVHFSDGLVLSPNYVMRGINQNNLSVLNFSQQKMESEQNPFINLESSLSVARESTSILIATAEEVPAGLCNYEDSGHSQKSAGEVFLLLYVGFSVLAGCKEFIVRFRKWNANREI